MMKIKNVFALMIICFVVGVTGYILKDFKVEEKLEKIKVAEVTHSVFYAPWYVALEKNYFEEEGLEIDLILTPGADKVTSAVLSNDVNIGFAGLEASIYVYNNGEKDYIENFSALTKRDGQFIVGPCDDDFKLNDLEGKSILAGRTGGMPLMNFVYALKQNNVDKEKIDINTSVEFAALSGAYIGKQGDYVNLFEPTASKITSEGYGCVLTSIGSLAGEVPYTVFSARKSYIEENEKIITSFTKVINKALKFVKNNSSEEIAKTIQNQFPDNSLSELSLIVERYKSADSWWDSSYIEEDAYNRLIDIMKYSGYTDDSPEFNILVNNTYNE